MGEDRTVLCKLSLTEWLPRLMDCEPGRLARGNNALDVSSRFRSGATPKGPRLMECQ